MIFELAFTVSPINFITFLRATFIGKIKNTNTPKAIKDNCQELYSNTTTRPSEDQNLDKNNLTLVIKPVVAVSASEQKRISTIPEVFLSKKAESLLISFLYKASFKLVAMRDPT